MKSISQVDKNFAVRSAIDKDDVKFYPVPSSEMKLYGVFYEDGKFRRLPESVAKNVSEGVHFLHANTAGGRVRFRTDSPYVAIHARLPFICRWANSSLCSIGGFDIYCDGEYFKSYMPDIDYKEEYSGVVDFGSRKMRDITVNMPLYSEVSELYIGLCDDAAVLEPTPYRECAPIVFYGSSITQGGCASRPGMAYQNFVSRHFNVDYINLGFSGNAKGEVEIADYIKYLDMSVFVYDYDFNAPDLEHLKATHERMFKEIREANPTLPIVIMSKPKYYLTDGDVARRDTIRKTYENALSRGDKNVYFIAGSELMEIAKGEGTVDGTHPNDLGFFSMATKLISTLEKII